jgi:hypothetical protein
MLLLFLCVLRKKKQLIISFTVFFPYFSYCFKIDAYFKVPLCGWLYYIILRPTQTAVWILIFFFLLDGRILKETWSDWLWWTGRRLVRFVVFVNKSSIFPKFLFLPSKLPSSLRFKFHEIVSFLLVQAVFKSYLFNNQSTVSIIIVGIYMEGLPKERFPLVISSLLWMPLKIYSIMS